MKQPSQVVGKGFLLACCFFASMTAPALADPPNYEIKEIKPDGTGTGVGINNSGQVVGEYEPSPGGGELRAFLYSDNEAHDIGTLGGGFARARDINDSGQITGFSTLSDEETINAFLYSEGVMEDLGNLGGENPQSLGLGLNNAGEVTGSSLGPPEGTRQAAFLYSGGTMQRLDLSLELGPCLDRSIGRDINDSSQVTGEVVAPVSGGCMWKAFIHSAGETLLIGDLLPGQDTRGVAINDSGQVAIHAFEPDDGGYLYADGEVERIGSVIPRGINNSGWVVGRTDLDFVDAHAFVYIAGELFNLDDLVTDLTGWERLFDAHDINDSGQITGVGTTAGGTPSAFLLTPLSINVRIDISPDSEKNPINLRSKGNITVAILSTGSFDATQVNWEGVTFGPDEATEIHQRSHVKDVDKDGDMDFLMHFKIGETGIRCDDGNVTLSGETFDGQSFIGTDEVKVVKCP